jgi:hypothetical protein
MSSKRNERLSGLFLAVVGTTLTIWNWQMAISTDSFYLKVAFFGPPSIVVGLWLTLFPDRISWTMFLIALGSGCLNLLALIKGWHF